MTLESCKISQKSLGWSMVKPSMLKNRLVQNEASAYVFRMFSETPAMSSCGTC